MNRPRCRRPRCFLFLVGLLALLDAPSLSAAGKEFPASEDSVRGRFHRLALVPAVREYTPARQDSLDAAFESLLVDRLRGGGFEVLDPGIATGIGRRIVDSLGGIFDPGTGDIDTVRANLVRGRVLSELADVHGADGFVYWRIMRVSASFYEGLAVWDDTKESIEKRSFLSRTMGLQYSGHVPAYSIVVIVDDRTGTSYYFKRSGIACASVLRKGKFVDRTPGEIFGDATRNAGAVDRALKPFCMAAMREQK